MGPKFKFTELLRSTQPYILPRLIKGGLGNPKTL